MLTRELHSLLEAIVRREDPAELAARAGIFLADDAARREWKAQKKRERRGRAPSGASRLRLRHAQVMRAVRLRAGAACELGDHFPGTPTEPHHLQAGAARRYLEDVHNVMLACRRCHDAFHLNPRAFVDRVKAWCATYNYPLPNRKEYR